MRQLTANLRLKGNPDCAERRVRRRRDNPCAPSPVTQEAGGEDQNRSLDAYA